MKQLRHALQSPVQRNILWVLAAALTVGVLSTTGTHAPAVFKRLGIFHAVFGAICGFIMAWLATELNSTRGRWQLATVVLLTLLGGVNLAWLSYGQLQQARQQLASKEADQLAAIKMLEKIQDTDPEMEERYLAERRRYAPRFDDYLAHRVSAVGEWKAPWPLLFWLGELLVAGGVAGGIFAWMQRKVSANDALPAAD